MPGGLRSKEAHEAIPCCQPSIRWRLVTGRDSARNPPNSGAITHKHTEECSVTFSCQATEKVDTCYVLELLELGQTFLTPSEDSSETLNVLRYGNSSTGPMMMELYNNGPIVVSFEPSDDFMFYSGGIFQDLKPGAG
eukprot:3870849-Amphidinium_carterae.1